MFSDLNLLTSALTAAANPLFRYASLSTLALTLSRALASLVCSASLAMRLASLVAVTTSSLS